MISRLACARRGFLAVLDAPVPTQHGDTAATSADMTGQ